jgi:hypothetical protein
MKHKDQLIAAARGDVEKAAAATKAVADKTISDLHAQFERERSLAEAETKKRVAQVQAEADKRIAEERKKAETAFKLAETQHGDIAQRLAEIEKREQEVLGLLEATDRKSPAASRKKPSGKADAAAGEGESWRESSARSHGAVADFWAVFASAQPDSNGQAAMAAAFARSATSGAPGQEEAYNRADAMRQALAAAKAEVEENNREAGESAPVAPKRNGAKRKSGSKPVKVTEETLQAAKAKEAPPAPESASEPISISLGPEAAARLKVLRRLNPAKTEAELMAILSAEFEKSVTGGKPKKRWFARSS